MRPPKGISRSVRGTHSQASLWLCVTQQPQSPAPQAELKVLALLRLDLANSLTSAGSCPLHIKTQTDALSSYSQFVNIDS